MALLKATGRRAFSKTYEDTWGEYEETPGDFTSLNFDGAHLFHKAKNLYLNENEVTGSLHPTQSEILTRELRGDHKGRLSPMLAGLFFSSWCDTYSSTPGASSTYTHMCKFKSSVQPSMKSRNMLELCGGAVRQYSGIVFPSFEISSEKEQFINATMGVLGYYATKTSSVTAANMETNKNTESYMNFGDLAFSRGTYNQSTDAYVATDTFTAKVRSLTIKCEVLLDENSMYQMGNTTTTVDNQIPINTKWTISGKLQINALDDATDDWLTDYFARTTWAVQVPITGAIAAGAVNYYIGYNFPVCEIASCDLTEDNGLLTRDIEITVLGTPNGTSAVVNIVNLLSTFQGTI